jgi:hypothetical protein
LQYIVKSGDCISSLASQYGFLWETIWNANPELRNLRNNPNVLMAGDVVLIPDKVVKEFACDTDQLHKFVIKGERAKFRLIVERYGIPLANRRFVLSVSPDVFKGTTDDNGLLEVSIDPTVMSGHLWMPDDNLECDLEMGYLDPVEETTGVQHRLHNLGFYVGELDGVASDELHNAIADFQTSVGLDGTGELDDTTTQTLFLRHDLVHSRREPQSPEHDETGNVTNSTARTTRHFSSGD